YKLMATHPSMRAESNGDRGGRECGGWGGGGVGGGGAGGWGGGGRGGGGGAGGGGGGGGVCLCWFWMLEATVFDDYCDFCFICD
ncbi:hypothetical protein, partial [Shewanella sp. AC34-MNA-CIBAN-0136]|uniref:hypothetical protein n=1 Tax=Shewanella sp. AC34-MNA-CIBAN-0136 TaxID=3140463 RepID=UPI0033169F6E